MRCFIFALFGAFTVLAAAAPASADINDYGFTLVTAELGQGPAEIAVRLVNRKTGERVPDAVIYATRLDMAPDGMPTMATALKPSPSAEAGTYRFKTNLTMEGGWRLSLAAKVQGETGTVTDELTLKTLP